jgi:hypothetical protein
MHVLMDGDSPTSAACTPMIFPCNERRFRAKSKILDTAILTRHFMPIPSFSLFENLLGTVN